MRRQEMLDALHAYRCIIAQMQGRTFYCEDEDGVLRRWLPPKRPIMDRPASDKEEPE